MQHLSNILNDLSKIFPEQMYSFLILGNFPRSHHEHALLHELDLRDELLLLHLQLLQRGGRGGGGDLALRRPDGARRLLAHLHHVRLLQQVDLELLLQLVHHLLQLLPPGLRQLGI